MQMMTVVV